MNLLNAKVVEAKEGLEFGLSQARIPVPAERLADLEKHSDIENVAAGLQGLDSSLAGVDTGLAGAAASG